MFCENCGNQIPDDSKFCHFCGLKVEGQPGAVAAEPQSSSPPPPAGPAFQAAPPPPLYGQPVQAPPPPAPRPAVQINSYTPPPPVPGPAVQTNSYTPPPVPGPAVQTNSYRPPQPYMAPPAGGVQAQPVNAPLTVGQYIGTFFLLAIPLVNLILLLLWSFGSSVNLNRKNFARATLIMGLISIVLWFIVGGVLTKILGDIMSEFY